jgi:hypothetical protein
VTRRSVITQSSLLVEMITEHQMKAMNMPPQRRVRKQRMISSSMMRWKWWWP